MGHGLLYLSTLFPVCQEPNCREKHYIIVKNHVDKIGGNVICIRVDHSANQCVSFQTFSISKLTTPKFSCLVCVLDLFRPLDSYKLVLQYISMIENILSIPVMRPVDCRNRHSKNCHMWLVLFVVRICNIWAMWLTEMKSLCKSSMPMLPHIYVSIAI